MAEEVDQAKVDEVLRQLKIKSGSAKRLHKELTYYEKEKEKEQTRVNKMKADGKDAHDIKQAENVLAESASMVPETKKALEGAYKALVEFMESDDFKDSLEAVGDSKELKEANEIGALLKEMFDTQ